MLYWVAREGENVMLLRHLARSASVLLLLLLAACDTTTPAPSAAGQSAPAPAAIDPSLAASPAASDVAEASAQTPASPSPVTSDAASQPASAAASATAGARASAAAGGDASPSARASAASSGQASAAASPEAVVDLEAAAEYCAEQGGTVVTRYPLFGSNLPPAQQLRLDGSLHFCQFERQFAESPDGFRSRISIALSTLYTEQPTLATVAYLNGPAPQRTPNPSINPGSFYCSQLGGTDVWGGQGSAAGGAWRTDDPLVADSAFGPDLEACIFPDGSIIDSWGLAYRNNDGAVRGVDLAEVIRYRPEGLPPLYPSGRATADLPEADATPPAFASVPASTPASAAASAVASAAASPGAFDVAAAEAYCRESGGRVVVRRPVWGTNGPPARWIGLYGSQAFCNFERAQPDNQGSDFRSQIDIALSTLYSEQPTMAMLAYLTPRPLPRVPSAVNPSSVYCSWLGGTSLFGGASNGAGGGWLKVDDATNAFEQISMCVFPDLSSISDWGLTYNAGGVVRGVDLATVARYQPGEAPDVFPDARPRQSAAEASASASQAATSNTVAIDETSNGGAVTLDQGQELVIALAANPSTGFAWEVDQIDEAVLRAAGDAEFRPTSSEPGIAGAPEIETLRFRAVGAGETTLTLVYRRPFEAAETPTPENSFTVQVTVR